MTSLRSLFSKVTLDVWHLNIKGPEASVRQQEPLPVCAAQDLVVNPPLTRFTFSVVPGPLLEQGPGHLLPGRKFGTVSPKGEANVFSLDFKRTGYTRHMQMTVPRTL